MWINGVLGGLLMLGLGVYMSWGALADDAKWSELRHHGARLTVQVVERHWHPSPTFRCRDCDRHYLVVRTRPPWSSVKARFPANQPASVGTTEGPGFRTLEVEHSVYSSAWAGQPLAVVQSSRDPSLMVLRSAVDEWSPAWWMAIPAAFFALCGLLVFAAAILVLAAPPPVRRRRGEFY